MENVAVATNEEHEKKIILRPAEAAKYIGCSEYTIRQMVRERRIPHYRIGVKILFTKNSLDKWIEEQEKKSVIIRC